MSQLDNINSQINKDLSLYGANMKNILMEQIGNKDIYKIYHNNKFLFYINLSNFSKEDLYTKKSQKWLSYKSEITNNIIKYTRSNIINYDAICIIAVFKNHNILMKCIASLQKQTKRPHIILSVCNEIDISFAITNNLEYCTSSSALFAPQIQCGIEFIRQKYTGVFGIMTLHGSELVPEKWFETIYDKINKYDIIGMHKDYVIDRHKTKTYSRIINQQKYRTIINNINFDLMIFTNCMFLKMDFLKRMNWNIYNDGLTDSTLLAKIYAGYPKIDTIDNLNVINVCHTRESSYSIQWRTKQGFYDLTETEMLSPQEDNMVTRFNLINNKNNNKTMNKKLVPVIHIKLNNDVAFDENYNDLNTFVDDTVMNKNKTINQYNKIDPIKPINNTQSNIKFKKIRSSTNTNIINDKLTKPLTDNPIASYKKDNKFNHKKAISINTLFKHVYVINLDKKGEYMDKMEELMNKYNILFERVDGIDPENSTISNEYLSLNPNGNISTVEEFSYLLSHIKALDMAIKNGYENILILEDNIVFHNDFSYLVSKITNVPKDWAILYLGCYHTSTMHDNKNYYIAKNNIGSFAYAIKKEHYSDMITMLSKRHDTIKNTLLQIQKMKKCYALYPSLVISYINSDNKQNTNMIELSNKANWNLDNYQYWGNSILYKISIVLPTWNGHPHIKKAIASITNQSYRNWEIIIVNDGSTQPELKKFLDNIRNNKIIVINLPKNGGLPNALNEGIKKCTGGYWTWISDDNEFKNDCFYNLKAEMDKGYDFVYSDYDLINEYKNSSQKSVKLDLYSYRTIMIQWNGMPCYLWKMDIIKKINNFDVDLYGAEDFDFVVKTFIATDNIGYINKSLMKYYKRNGTITSRLGDKITVLKNQVISSYNNIEIYKNITKFLQTPDIIIIMLNNSSHVQKYMTLLKPQTKNNNFIFVVKNYGISKDVDKNILYINIPIFDKYIKKFKIVESPQIFIYDDIEFKQYEKIIDADTNIFALMDDKLKVTSEITEHIKTFSNIVIPNYNGNIKNISGINIIKNSNDFDKYLGNYSKNTKYLFNIGLIENTNEIDHKFEEYMAHQLFNNCKIIKLSPSNVQGVDFILSLCDVSSFVLKWNDSYIDKFVYMINLRDYGNNNPVINKNIKYIHSFDYMGAAKFKCPIIKNKLVVPNLSRNKLDGLNRKFIGFCVETIEEYHVDILNNLSQFAGDNNLSLKIIIFNKDNIKNQINIVNDIADKIVKINDTIDEIITETISCQVLCTDNYNITLFCLTNNITSVYVGDYNDGPYVVELYKYFGFTDNLYHTDIDKIIDGRGNSNIGFTNDISDMKINIIKNCLRIIHFGAYWQLDNDIVKLMLGDLCKLTKTLEIDTKIFINTVNEWYYNYEPEPIKYPGKLIRYLTDDKVKSIIKKFDPHIMITNSGGLTFSNEMFKQLKKMGIITVGISLSDPDVYPYNGKYYAHKYDYFYTNAQYSFYKEYTNIKNKRLLPFGCSTDLHKPMDNNKKYDVIVVGGARHERIIVMNELVKHFNVGVYGGGWPLHFNAIKVNGLEHVKALNSGHIYISFSQTTAGYMNVKVGLFEAAACKIALFTEHFDEIDDYFTIGKDIITYKTVTELVEKIKYYLNNRNELEELKNNSYNRFLKDHQWSCRWSTLLCDIF